MVEKTQVWQQNLIKISKKINEKIIQGNYNINAFFYMLNVLFCNTHYMNFQKNMDVKKVNSKEMIKWELETNSLIWK